MKLGVTLDILNQKDTPAFYADTLANRPAAGFTGRVFISTDTLDLYRDTGTTWVLLSPSSTGTITGSGAAGQVTYFSAASSITGSNNLFWDTANNRLGVNTNTPTATFDVHGTTNVIAQLNQLTAGQNALLTFMDNSVGKWRLGNIYNAAANDFGIVDITNTLQRLTIKNTGQTFIGTETSSSGLFVVNSATGDNHIVAIGATAPSIRVRNAGTAPTQQFGLGLATGVNNFIQGAASGDFCIFNGSTTSSPILFGVYSTTNVVEAARISSAFNLLVGGVVDNGRKLQVTGDGSFSSNGLFGGSTNPGNAGSFTISVGVPGSTAGGIQLWAATNQSSFLQFGDSTTPADNYRGSVGYNHNTDSLTLGTAGSDRLIINNLGYIGIGTNPIEKLTNDGLIAITGASVTSFYVGNNNAGFIDYSSGNTRIGSQSSAGNSTIQFYTTSGGYTNINERARITSSGNTLIGTTTDDGNKFQVNGTAYINGFTNIGVVNNGIHQLGVYVSGGADRNILQAAVNGVSNGFRVRYDNATSTVRVSMTSLPTSSVGLSAGDLWNNLGILNIV